MLHYDNQTDQGDETEGLESDELEIHSATCSCIIELYGKWYIFFRGFFLKLYSFARVCVVPERARAAKSHKLFHLF